MELFASHIIDHNIQLNPKWVTEVFNEVLEYDSVNILLVLMYGGYYRMKQVKDGIENRFKKKIPIRCDWRVWTSNNVAYTKVQRVVN